jgi:hypothetical protein
MLTLNVEGSGSKRVGSECCFRFWQGSERGSGKSNRESDGRSSVHIGLYEGGLQLTRCLCFQMTAIDPELLWLRGRAG